MDVGASQAIGTEDKGKKKNRLRTIQASLQGSVGRSIACLQKKVAITACMRKLLVILNAMMRDQKPFRYLPAA